MSATEKAHRFPCPGCGADLAFDPQDGGLTCTHCGRREAIPQSAEQVVEKSYEDYLKVRPELLQAIAEGALEVACEGCGATISFTPPQVSANCPFCGRNRVSQGKSADPMVAPQGLLPFALTRPQAKESVHKWLGSLWFAPSALQKMARQDRVVGVYLPFWTYDAHTTSHYTGERGDAYYEQQTYTENGVRKTRNVRKVRWSSRSGTVTLWHDDVVIAATQAVSQDRLRALEPWDFGKLTAYDPAYLAGHEAQRYQLDVAKGFELAKAVMEEHIHAAVKRDIGGDEQRVHDVRSSYSGITFKHLLLPVYLGAYTFAAKVYQIVVNARTGEVQGDRPYSWWKIAGALLLALLALLCFAWLKGQ
jgi:ribosomal protein S27E